MYVSMYLPAIERELQLVRESLTETDIDRLRGVSKKIFADLYRKESLTIALAAQLPDQQRCTLPEWSNRAFRLAVYFSLIDARDMLNLQQALQMVNPWDVAQVAELAGRAALHFRCSQFEWPFDWPSWVE